MPLEQILSIQSLRELTLEQVQAAIVSDRFNETWCGFTLAYFTICLLLVASRVLVLRSSLGRVMKPIHEMDGLEVFARDFETYDRTVRSVKRLRHAWQEFAESLILPREGEPLRVRNTQEPSAFFNDATVVQPVIHNRFFDTVPSHLVGLGILGTFLGLAAGVGLASGELNSEDPKQVQAALSTLLSGASLAFVTSIFGLGSSIVFLFFERLLVGSVHRALDGWVNRLEACVELVTLEQITLEQLGHEKRQTKQLEGFSDQLVFALEQAFDSVATERLAPSLEKVVQAIEGLRIDRADTNQAGIERLVREFLEKLSQSTGQEMQQIQATLQTLGVRLTEITESLQEASRGLGEQIVGAGAQIQSSGHATAEGLEASIRPFAEAIARFETATRGQAELAVHVENMTSGLRAAAETLLEAHRGFQASLEPSRAVTASLEVVGGRLAGAVEEARRLAEQAAGAASSITAEQHKISTAWQEYERRFQDVDQSLLRAFEQLDLGLQAYADKVRQFHLEIDQQMSKAIQALATHTSELTEAVEDLGEKISTDRQ